MYGCTNLGVKSMEKWGNRKKIGNKVEHKYPGGIFTVRIISTNSWFRHSETSILMQKKGSPNLRVYLFHRQASQRFFSSRGPKSNQDSCLMYAVCVEVAEEQAVA